MNGTNYYKIIIIVCIELNIKQAELNQNQNTFRQDRVSLTKYFTMVGVAVSIALGLSALIELSSYPDDVVGHCAIVEEQQAANLLNISVNGTEVARCWKPVIKKISDLTFC